MSSKCVSLFRLKLPLIVSTSLPVFTVSSWTYVRWERSHSDRLPVTKGFNNFNKNYRLSRNRGVYLE